MIADIDSPKVIPLIGGWYFVESSRVQGVTYYVLMSPSGIAGSDEYHEDELKGALLWNLLSMKAAQADDPENWISLEGMTDEEIKEALFQKT